MSLTTANDMQFKITWLKTLLHRAQTTVADTTWFGSVFSGGSSSRDAVIANVTRASADIARLDKNRAAVLAGTMSYEYWFDFGAAIESELRSITKDASNWTFTGVLSSTSSETFSEVKDIADETLKMGNHTILLVVIGLIAFAVIRVAGLLK